MKKNAEIFFWAACLLMNISLCSFAQENYCFIENKGQLQSSVVSKVKVPGGAIFIENGGFRYSFYNGLQLQKYHVGERNETWIDAHGIAIDFLNKNPNSEIVLSEKSDYFENFYNTESWAENVHFYKSLTHKNIYNGITLHMYFSNNNLKYDIIISPESSPKKIKLKYSGQEKLFLKNGHLIIQSSVNTVTELKPFSYQIVNGKKVEVISNFKLRNNILSYSFPNGYDRSKNLIIDPVLIFSTYSGSIADNFGYTATYDNNGFLYSGSTVFDVGYPTTLGAYQINWAGGVGTGSARGTDIAITKYSDTTRVYSTYLGGSMDELPHSMIVNMLDELFVFGTSGSDDYPTTNGAYDTTFNGGNSFAPSGLGVSFPNGSDIIVSRLSANGGNLLASTYVGGSDNDGLNTAQKLKRNYADEVRGEIDIDQNNNIYLATCTYSSDFPITNTFQQNNNGNQEGCVIKMDNQLSSIIWGSYLGGSNDDAIYSLALDKSGNVFVTGGTTSDNFPISANAYQNTYLDSIKADAFITHISSDGTTIINSSYFGSNKYDQSYFVELNAAEEVYILGQTKALGNTFVQNANYFHPEASQFIAILSNNLDQLIRSTVVGTGKGTPDISPTAFLVDVCNNIYISGWGGNTGGGTLSTLNMPITNNAYQSTTDGNDFYIMVLDNELDSLIYGTYFGGSQSAEHVDGGTSRFDKNGVIYQAVCAGCRDAYGVPHSDFPTTPGAVSNTNNSANCNSAVFKFDFDFPLILANFDAPWVSCNNNIIFTNTSNNPGLTSYFWDFGDGNTSIQSDPTHQYLGSGLFDVTLIASSPISCNFSDTIIKQIYILSNTSTSLPSLEICQNESIQIGVLPINNPAISYLWFPSTGLNNVSIPNPIATVNSSTLYSLIISDGICSDTIHQWVNIDSIDVETIEDTSFCKDPIFISVNTGGIINNILWSTNNNFTDTISLTDTYLAENVGTYYVMVENDKCIDIDSVSVFNNNILIELIGTTEICEGDSVFIKANDLNPLNPITSYNWQSIYELDFHADSSSFISYPDSSGYFQIIAKDALGCFVADSIFVKVHKYPMYDSIWAVNSTIFIGEKAHLNILTEDCILWSTGDTIASVSLYPESSKNYSVIIYNEFCQIKDSIYIEVKDVFCDENKIIIPNAFSPNEDNRNDYYRIVDEDGIITEFKLEIFNRFGQKVYSSIDIGGKWDGHFQNKSLPSQIFDYYLEIKCIGEKSLFKKGNISLIK